MSAGSADAPVGSWAERHWRSVVGAALVFALLVRLGVVLGAPDLLGGEEGRLQGSYLAPRLSFTEGDASNYDQMATNFLAGRGMVYGEHLEHRAARPPLYPLFLALVYTVAGRSALSVGLAHVLLGVITVALVGLIGRRCFGAPAAVLAMVGVALEPQLMKYSARVYSETLMVLLVALMVLAHLWSAERRSLGSAAVAGLTVGLAFLCRQTVLPFAFFGALWLAWAWRERPVPAGRNLLAYALVIGLVVGLYSGRNVAVQGEAAPLTTAAPGTLWLNNNPVAKTVWEDPPREEVGHPGMGLPATGRAEQTPPELGSAEVQAYHRYEHNVVRYVLENPGRYLVLSVSRAMLLWNLWPTTPPRIEFFLLFWTILVFAVVGTIVTWRSNRLTSLLFLLILCYTLVHAASYAIPRYRVPVMPWVVLLAAVGVVALVSAWWERRRGKAAAAAPEAAEVEVQ